MSIAVQPKSSLYLSDWKQNAVSEGGLSCLVAVKSQANSVCALAQLSPDPWARLLSVFAGFQVRASPLKREGFLTESELEEIHIEIPKFYNKWCIPCVKSDPEREEFCTYGKWVCQVYNAFCISMFWLVKTKQAKNWC